MTMIETKDLTFAYPAEEGKRSEPALRGVSLGIEKGSFVVVLGHNGSGKSTLAKHMNAVLLPSGGAVYVEGMDTHNQTMLLEIRRRVGMVFQNPDTRSSPTWWRRMWPLPRKIWRSAAGNSPQSGRCLGGGGHE